MLLSRFVSRRIICLSVLCGSLSVPGCGGPSADYSTLDLVDVEGVIKLDGEPVANAVVGFQDVTTGTESFGLTDASGHYRLMFDSVKSGIIPGEKRVVVSTTRVVPGLNGDEGGGDELGESPEEGEEAGSERAKELIPEAYRRDSKLLVTVDESNSTFNFNLAADGSTTGPE